MEGIAMNKLNSRVGSIVCCAEGKVATLRKLALGAMSVGLVSCAVPLDDGIEGGAVENVDSAEDAITGGSLVTTNSFPYSAVVRLNRCTATKIGERKYLTAAHCVSGKTSGGTIRITNSLDGAGRQTYTLTAVHIHPTYELTGASYGDVAYDIAVVEVAEFNDIPAITHIGLGHVPAFQTGITVGYGCDASSTNDGQKQMATFTAHPLSDYLAAGPGETSFKEGEYTFNVINRSDSIALCPGDSGGPRLQLINNVWAVVGVNSYYYGFPWSFQSRVGHVTRWVQQPGKNILQTGSGGFFVGKSGFCLQSSNPLRQEYCDGRDQTRSPQFFTLTHAGDGFLIEGAGAFQGSCLAAVGATGLGMPICQGAGASSRWRFLDRGDGTVSIQNIETRNCIQTSTEGQGASPIQGACTPNRMSMRWAFSR
jgi:hypothetical protein